MVTMKCLINLWQKQDLYHWLFSISPEHKNPHNSPQVMPCWQANSIFHWQTACTTMGAVGKKKRTWHSREASTKAEGNNRSPGTTSVTTLKVSALSHPKSRDECHPWIVCGFSREPLGLFGAGEQKWGCCPDCKGWGSDSGVGCSWYSATFSHRHLKMPRGQNKEPD